ncbi:MAG: ClbS/DfsB family four-helix bundle protein [Chloroflexi bacterium]|nr:ClbS/DfsB family four-helix bundle protein [Chloroflexota bacterium]
MPDVLDAVLEENAAACAELMHAIDAVPEAWRTERGVLGDWSLKDLVAHLAYWQDGWAHALELVASGERPQIPGYDNDDDFNARNVAASQGESWEQVLARLRSTRERHEAAVRGLRALDADRYAEGRTPHRLASAGSHDREHLPAIEAWRRAQGL